MLMEKVVALANCAFFFRGLLKRTDVNKSKLNMKAK